jgi:hypothetical protein
LFNRIIGGKSTQKGNSKVGQTADGKNANPHSSSSNNAQGGPTIEIRNPNGAFSPKHRYWGSSGVDSKCLGPSNALEYLMLSSINCDKDCMLNVIFDGNLINTWRQNGGFVFSKPFSFFALE